MNKLTLSYYSGAVNDLDARPETPDSVDPTPEALAAWLKTKATTNGRKASAGYYVAARVRGRRKDANAAPTNVVALDWDDAPVNWGALEPYAYVAHTTDSSTPGAERWRVWLLLDAEYAGPFGGRFAVPAEWEGAYLRGLSQPAFVPTAPDARWVTHDGARLSLAAWGRAEAPPAPPAPPAPAAPPGPRREPSQASTNALVTRWLSNPDGTNRLAGATGAALAEWGWSDGEIAAYLAAWLHADPRLAKHTDDAVRAARTRRDGAGAVPGFPTLEMELGGPFREAGPDPKAQAEALWAALDSARAANPAPPQPGPAPAGGGSQNPLLAGAVSAGAIASWVAPPVPWLVEALAVAPGAPALVSGYNGSGKTTFVQHLAVAVATPGASALGGALDVRHGSVLHIDHEQGLSLTMRRYQQLGLTAEADLDLVSFPQWSLGNPDPAARKAFVEAATGRALVIVDSLLASCAGYFEDGENASTTREPLDFLTQVSEATGAVVLVIHHSKKDRSTRRTAARGSSAITDAVSVHLSYEREDDDDLRSPSVLALAKVRQLPTPRAWLAPVVVRLAPRGAPADGGVQLVLADAEAEASAKAESLKTSIVNLLATGWEGSATALVRELKKDRSAVYAALTEAYADGTLSKTPRGPRLVVLSSEDGS